MKTHHLKEGTMRESTKEKTTTTAEDAVLKVEDRFFAALSRRDRGALELLVADDCILVDVLTGSEVPRSVFLELVGSERLVFESIEPLGARVRMYGVTAVVNGETRMVGRFETQRFTVHSRYTHVYAHMKDGFRLINAQGTPVTAVSA
jgi:ketosteroid isomerase-like protein